MDRIEAMKRIEDHMRVHHMKESPNCMHITEALKMALNALGAIEQIAWERNIALEQLEELGLSLGQKIDGVYLSKEEYNRLLECADKRYKYGKNLFVNTQFR